MQEHEYTQPIETYELLSTKLAVPRLHASLVAREALLARLDGGLERKLTLLSAPAGFGKTTLASMWLDARSMRQDWPCVAWISLDAGDNDPIRFWRYLVAACQRCNAHIGASTLEVLQASQRLPLESVLIVFLNELSRLEWPILLVLDDYNVITTPQIHESVTYFVSHLPAMMHLMILTRSDPPLPLARLRAHDDLYELHAADLRFTFEETQAFLQQMLSFSFSSEAVSRLEARVEGWVTGLRLLTLALQGRREPHDLDAMLGTFNGSYRHVLEYLLADVLALQPVMLQEFLLQTAFLDRLTGPLCDAITGRNDGDAMLEQLERANLFLQTLDDEGRWYRYHALFAEAMQHEARRRLGEDALRTLQDRASRWYEQQHLLPEAVEVALVAGDFERAAILVERIIGLYNTTNELHTLLRWIEQLPEDVLQEHAKLCLSYAVALMFTLDRSAPITRTLIERPLEIAGRLWQAEGNTSNFGVYLAVRSLVTFWQGDLAQAFAGARRALELLPEQEQLWRGTSMLSIGMEEFFAGRPGLGQQMTREARRCLQAAGNLYGARAALHILGDIYAWQGELHTSAQILRQELVEAADDPFDQGDVLVGLAGLSYEWNELDAAEEMLSQALEICQRHAEDFGPVYTERFLRIPALLVQAQVYSARGKLGLACDLLQELIPLTQERGWGDLYREVLATLARIQNADRLATQRWSAIVAQLGEDVRVIQQEREALILARLHIIQGDAQAALALLERWRAWSQEQRCMRSELAVQTLMALAYAESDRRTQATSLLKSVLSRAQAEGHQRLFLDEGEAIIPLLRAVLSDVQEPLAAYVRSLLATLDQQEAPSTSRTTPAPLIEPLSQQEQRVLRLLVSGRSNPEIAEALVVSVNTVKTQLQSIYRKLNVKSRWEAREATDRLKLL